MGNVFYINYEKKVLVITTDLFPYGHSELLYSENIGYLSQQFDVIEIFSRANDNELKYNLPDNVFVNQLDSTIYILENLSNIIRFLFISFFKELKYLRSRDVMFSYPCLKVYLNTVIQSVHYSNQIEKRLRCYNSICTDFYSQSYWCNESFLAILFLKKYNLVSFQITSSYLHGYDLVWERHYPVYLPLRWFIVDNANKLFFVSEFGKNIFNPNLIILQPL